MFENISLNTFDYFAIAFIIWQTYVGYKRGFEDMLYGIVKYIVIIAGLYVGNNFLWDIMMRSPYFVKRTIYINETAKNYLLQFSPDGNLPQSLYKQAIDYIAFDKVVFGIGLVIIIVFLTRIIIYGSIVKEESEHKKLGMVFAFIKAVIMVFVISKFLEVVLGANFDSTKEGSFILNLFEINILNYKEYLNLL